jgi:hypothetical protein
MTTKVNLKLADINRLSRSRGQNLACMPSGFNFIVNLKLPFNSAKRTSSACQTPSIIFKPQLSTVSKFNTSALPYRGAEWK